ncbi:MAG: alpha-2-macroglobulin family protein [Myxococcaceae bacterium]
MNAKLMFAVLSMATAASAQQYTPADVGQRPTGGGVKVLPETFLRGYDPVTAYFPDDQVATKSNADDGPKRLKVVPDWPGQWEWVDRRTLQFRPAEPWPALARFQFTAGGATRTLTTMMSAPQQMVPSSGSESLKPFRTLTLTFPQALSLPSLKRMLTLEIRDLPGLNDSPRRKVDNYSIALLPRATHRDAATYAITLEDDVPEGKQLVVNVSLALGSEGTTLWTGRASTRTAFSLDSVRCGSNSFSLLGGASTPKDLALACGNRGDAPQLVFSAPVKDLTLTQLRKLVRLEPAVNDLHFTVYGTQVQLQGKFVPDTLYKLSLGPAPIADDSGRPLRDVKPAEVYFHLGWKAAFLKWNQSTAIVESKGPRTLPLTGYGDARADVRIYRVDPLHQGLWPFPASPVVIDEQSAPPFPGEEPSTTRHPSDGYVDPSTLSQHIRLLGSPLVSKVVDLPLADKGNTTHFGLDLKPLLDGAVGANKPGTYLVGLRRLTGRPERAWVRVQVTNLSVTSVEERDKAVLFVRALDTGEPVRGAVIKLEGKFRPLTPEQLSNPNNKSWKPNTETTFTTDDSGRATLDPLFKWEDVSRISVASGDDVLVFDPREAPPRFANNHWSSTGSWLSWLATQSIPDPVNESTLGFIFTERPIYKPGETVHVKAFVRLKRRGDLKMPSSMKPYGLNVTGPDGQVYPLTPALSALGGLAADLTDANLPTGDLVANLYEGDPGNVIARRSFKIEAYRIPTFEVRITGKDRVRLDAPFKVKALARYYAGGNVANQPVSWTVTQTPYYWVPKGLPGFLFASSTQFARPQAQHGRDTISQQGELDDTGAAEITLNPQLDLDGSARLYHFEATVTGADEQPVTAVDDVKALPPFVLGLKVPRYLESATSLTPQVVAVGVDEKALKGQEVRVRLFKRVWHSNLRETSFATGQAKYVTEQEDVQLSEKTVTTTEKPLDVGFEVKDAGVYVVELFARDKLGRVQTLQADLYIGGQTPLAWNKTREGVFELKPDKKKYAPGDVAHVVVESPYTSARALVVIEEPGGNTYSWKDVSGGKTVVDVKISELHTPNLPLHVVLMRGRLGEGKADDARYKPASAASSIDLEVEPVKNTLLVNVQHPDTARPGTKQDFVITLADDQKRPVGGEVTFWLVDEAVLSLAREGSLDPLTEMIRRNARASTIHDTRNLVLGRVSEQEEEPGGDGSADDEDKQGKKLVRKNFKTVPFYQATVVVPASGKLVLPITLSDDLTNFKVRAVAVSGERRFGFKQSTLKVRLPVLVQPQLPRFVRVGDKFWPGGVARIVEGPDGPAQVEIKLTGAVEGKASSSEKLSLKSTKAESVVTPVTVKAVPTVNPTTLTVRVDVTRLSDKAGDAFEVKLPLLPDRSVEKFAWFETLQPGKTQLKPFPEAARPGTATQTYVVSNQPGILELASGLDYLSQYPHGCLEQRMSQVAPDLLLSGFLKKMELETRFTPVMQASTRRILDELAQYQDDSGFFAYWPGAKGDIALTAQGVEFMTMAKKAGINTDEKVRARAMEGLRRTLRSDFNGFYASYRWNQQALAVRALATANDVDEHYLIELFQNRKNMDATASADLSLAMAQKPAVFSSNLSTLQGELWDGVVFKLVKGAKVFDSIRGDRPVWDGHYLGSSTATIAVTLEALSRLSPSDPRLDLLRDALLSRAGGNGFGSTHDNRRAIAALAAYVEKAGGKGVRSSVTFPGAPSAELDDSKRAARRTVSSGEAPLVTVSGGPVGVRVAYAYLPETSGDKVTAKKDGFVVSRSLTWLHPDGQAPTHHDDAPGGHLDVGLGDVLEMHARVTNDTARNHVALVVPIAAGLEPLNPALANVGSDAIPSESDSLAPTYVQRLDHEVRYYFYELPAGTFSFHFRVRASNEGSFVHPAPYAEMMYRESVRGRGAGMRINVKGAHEK